MAGGEGLGWREGKVWGGGRGRSGIGGRGKVWCRRDGKGLVQERELGLGQEGGRGGLMQEGG